MKDVCFLCPTYPPHFEYAIALLRSFFKNKLDKQADLFFIFTNEKEKEKFIKYDNILILPEELRIFENGGIINIKKLYAISKLKNKYKYIIVIDDEAKFVKNLDLLELSETYFNNKILYGNTIISEWQFRTDKVLDSCRPYFKNHKDFYKLNTKLYLWFNQLCVYKSDTIDEFFRIINYDKIIKTISFWTFDYYLYMYYLILYKNFTIEDIGIEAGYGFGEHLNLEDINFLNEKYKTIKFNLATPVMYKKINKEKVLLIVHIDRNLKYEQENFYNSIKHFKKHWKNFFQPIEKNIKYFLRWLSEPLSIIFYIIVIVLNFVKFFINKLK